MWLLSATALDNKSLTIDDQDNENRGPGGDGLTNRERKPWPKIIETKINLLIQEVLLEPSREYRQVYPLIQSDLKNKWIDLLLNIFRTLYIIMIYIIINMTKEENETF